ncbi:DUF1343 domain-containing protein [Winogradskyella eckloniae]|uniref:exo-beta-N-acetylmuramidase NamZ family protein n=1 Tax=Winogradskyella eckloniae TaxID=1089306 RepID=UPI0015650DDD|nr:DUF1343 domain-containing protein [Winogradskyella eckloniae]NRD20764.1 DUF1343 domain-containing protein [Winogradskyella eckloniae]
MLLKVVKNTVLFSIIIGIFLFTFSCGNRMKTEVGTGNENISDGKATSSVLNVTDSVSIAPTHSQTIATQNQPIIVGANRTEQYIDLLKNKRIGIVANLTSVIDVTPRALETIHSARLYIHLVDSLLKHQINIKKVFSPEHGFRGTADAGELVKDGVDTKTNLPIISLHGKYKKPTKAHLKDIDLMVFDIQDVGVRFYTYISTLHYVMEACAENDIPLLILDRPNPNGNYIDGPVLEKKHSSFLGMHPIPLVHGMTIGEYAKMINGEAWLNHGIKCDITVVELKNYSHSRSYKLPIRPSPNLPNDQSIRLYPSLGLFEGTNINAGRGTEYQFQRYGAPFLDKNHYPFSYTPVSNFGSKYPKHQNKICYGVDLSTIKAERSFSLKYIIDAYHHATDKSKFFNTSNFTTHAGTSLLQQQIESGLTEEAIKATWKKDLEAYKKRRRLYLIYN